MLIHRTTSIVGRATDIANGEAEPVWIRTGDYDQWLVAWQESYTRALRELAGVV